MTRKIAIIPARSGSKGIKNKNTILIKGKPLIEWTLEAAIFSKCFNKIFVTTDDINVENICKKHDVEIIKRPKHLCEDETPMVPVIIHALKVKDIPNGTCCLLQPTSPLRSEEHIKEAFKIFTAKHSNSLISVCEHDNEFLKSFFIDDQILKPISNSEFPFMRRQELPKIYKSNGSIYMFDIKTFLNEKSFYLSNTIPFIMNKKSSLDIDTHDDLAFFKNILNEEE